VSALFAFLHHLAAFALVASLVVEFVVIRDDMSARTARRLALADLVLGVSAGVLLVVGLLRVFYFEKGAAFYFSSGAFIASPTFRQYRYAWLRDGAFIAEGLDLVGRLDASGRFHDWVAGLINDSQRGIERSIAIVAAGGSPAR